MESIALYDGPKPSIDVQLCQDLVNVGCSILFMSFPNLPNHSVSPGARKRLLLHFYSEFVTCLDICSVYMLYNASNFPVITVRVEAETVFSSFCV